VNRPVPDPRADQEDEALSLTLGRRHARAAVELLRAITDASDRGHRSSQDAAAASRPRLADQASAMLQRRRRRTKYLGPIMFGEPAWDMLLFLYAHDGGNRFKISQLVEQAGSPATTCLRWLEYLESEQLVRKKRHPLDARAYFVELTEKAREALDSYLSETASSWP
jgi:DNA-binding MarR family transcriptional regulator